MHHCRYLIIYVLCTYNTVYDVSQMFSTMFGSDLSITAVVLWNRIGYGCSSSRVRISYVIRFGKLKMSRLCSRLGEHDCSQMMNSNTLHLLFKYMQYANSFYFHLELYLSGKCDVKSLTVFFLVYLKHFPISLNVYLLFFF